jgi:feruloyl esterase
MACDRVLSIELPDVKIAEAVALAAADAGPIRAAHCRVTGTIGTEIRFSLLLPDAWNGKFLMGGGGGFVGEVENQAQASVNAGYATAGTDTGHKGSSVDASWAMNNVERQVNYGYLGVHRTAETAKAIVRRYYGTPETQSYFVGCSNGGRQAMMEAQRFPDDFTGIVSGAPALDFVGIAAQFIKDIQAVFPDKQSLSTPVFSTDVLKSIEAQIVDRCDAADGLKDGLIDDPRSCKVDVAAMTGLTDPQRSALKKVYAETTGPAEVLYPGQPVGGEGEGGEGEPAGWAAWIVGGGPQRAPQGPSLRFVFGTQFFKYLVFGDPSWDYTQYDVSHSRKDARLAGTFLNATDPDLGPFKAKGHKLIVWHGWSDPALSALGTIKYYDQVQSRDSGARDYIRLFLMPGVLHCGGGPGPSTVDWPAVLSDWVERGKGPDSIVARKLAGDGTVSRSRPLCVYPQRAQYKGSGSPDDAASFVCK